MMKVIPNYEAYQIDCAGRIFRNGRRLCSWQGRNGYMYVGLSKASIVKTRSVHALVALAFLGCRPPGKLIRHINGIKTDNRVRNLAYGTYQENALDAKAHGVVFGSKIRGLNSVWGKLTKIKQRKIRAAMGKKSFRAIAREIGVHHSTVSAFVKGVTYR